MIGLDHDTADRLLSGAIPPDDAPPSYRAVADLIAAVREPGVTDPASEARAVADFAEVVGASRTAVARPRGTSRRASSKRSRTRVVLAAAVGGLVVGGLAAAGALPGVSAGNPPVDTPSPNANAGEHPNVQGPSSDHPPSSVPPSTPPDDTNGADISATARSDLEGLEKGAAVSDAASGGTSQAGEHGAPTSLPASPTLPPQASTPPQADRGLDHLPG